MDFHVGFNRVDIGDFCKNLSSEVFFKEDALSYLSKLGFDVSENGVVWCCFYFSSSRKPIILVLSDVSLLKKGAYSRIKNSVRYLDFLVSRLLSKKDAFKLFPLMRSGCGDAYIVGLQYGDSGLDMPNTVCFDSHFCSINTRLIPDIYYFNNKGYQAFGKELSSVSLQWGERLGKAFWRGSTTGHPQGGGRLDIGNVDSLPRVKLCGYSRSHSTEVDAKITNVSKTKTEKAKCEVSDYLLKSGFLGEPVPQIEFSRYKYLIDIDGNVTAWGLLQKLMMGSAILKVRSERRQWFYKDLLPWVHYIPVEQDMSDLVEKIQWCKDNDDNTREIAENGQRFADSFSFDSQMNFAAEQLLSAARVVNEK